MIIHEYVEIGSTRRMEVLYLYRLYIFYNLNCTFNNLTYQIHIEVGKKNKNISERKYPLMKTSYNRIVRD